MVQAYWKEVEAIKPKCLWSAANSPLQDFGSTRLLIQLGQQVTRTGFLVVENLVVHMFLGTAFNDKYIKRIYPKQGVVVPTSLYLVALET